jgi:glycosyltransferase involved in cell wall biosynthesis
MQLPIITIVIANHNYDKWLIEAVTSAVTQDYANKQVFVVDDASTDKSWFMLSQSCGLYQTEDNLYTGQLLGTKVYAARNMGKPQGPSASRNLAIRQMFNSTHLFGFLDADDIYLPGKISKSVNKFLQDPNRIGGIYSDYDTLNVHNHVRIRVYKEPFDREKLFKECIIHSACIINKLAIQHCGMYDEEMRTCEDYDLWLRISGKFVFVHIPESLMLVRVGLHNSSATVDNSIWQRNWQRIRDKVISGYYA